MRPSIDLSRRDFVTRAAIGAFSVIALKRVRITDGDDVSIVDFADDGTRKGIVTVPRVMKTDAEWRTQLSPLAFFVARQGGTERPFSGAFWNLHTRGLFRCVCCDTALFSSAHKFDSGTGWPSYWQPIAEENVVHGTPSSGFTSSEVKCRRCDAHLGDLFDDGPQPTGLRYCIDSVSLKFIKQS